MTMLLISVAFVVGGVLAMLSVAAMVLRHEEGGARDGHTVRHARVA
jgi:hypothetical protein